MKNLRAEKRLDFSKRASTIEPIVEPIIRRAVKNDIEGIYLLSCKVHQTSYATLIPDQRYNDFLQHFACSVEARRRRYNFYLPKLNDPDWFIWVAELDGKVVGYTKEKRTDSHTVHKQGLFVDSDYQGRGIGSALFKESLVIARPGDRFQLSVIENNTRAQQLYQKYGFTKTGYAKNDFYGARMITMELAVN